MSFLQLQGVKKYFGDLRVIKGIDLSISAASSSSSSAPRAAASPRCCG
jgi:ABC-type polar amino acid transport system ATPase subunit